MAAAQVLHDACPALITRAERRLIGADLARARTMLKNADEKPPCDGQVPSLGHQHVDDLPVLVDRPIQIDPSPRDLDVSSTNQRSPGAGRQGWAASISSGVNRCSYQEQIKYAETLRTTGWCALAHLVDALPVCRQVATVPATTKVSIVATNCPRASASSSGRHHSATSA